MEARYWLGLGLLALCLGTGFADVGTNSTFALIAVLTLGVSLLVPQRWLWVAYAFWGGVLATFGVFVWLSGAPDLKPTAVLFLGGAVGLIYTAQKSLREIEVLSKLSVWVPCTRWSFLSACTAARQGLRRGWSQSVARMNAGLELESARLSRMLHRRGA